jgi:hypothetical protein
MARDQLLSYTTDRAVAEGLMNDHHWVSDEGSHYVVTAVRHIKDPFGKSMWPFHGYLEPADNNCPIGRLL